MIDRLQREGIRKAQIDALSEPPPDDWNQFYADHPAEIEVAGEDLVRLTLMASVLAGARSFAFHGPIRMERKSETGCPDFFEAQSWSSEVRRWELPRPLRRVSNDQADTARSSLGGLDLAEVSRYCRLVEPFFRPAYWHTGRFAVALGSLWASITSVDLIQSYLAV